MSGEYEFHPNGQVSIGGLPLVNADATDWSLTNGAKHRATLHNKRKGYTTAGEEASGNIKLMVPAGGTQYDYVEMVKNPKGKSFEFKDAGNRHRIEGILQTFNWSSDIGNGGVVISLSWIGAHISSKG